MNDDWIKKTIKKMKKGGYLQYDEGGFLQTVSPALDMVAPGLGSAAQLLGTLFNDEKEETPRFKAGTNSNPFNAYKKGGDFIEYKGKTHEQGGELIDINGNPTKSDPVAEVEKGETLYKEANNSYVFSEELDTAKESKRINEMFKGDDVISRRAKDMLMRRLMKKNNQLKFNQEVQENPEKFDLGGPLADTFSSPFFDRAASQFPLPEDDISGTDLTLNKPLTVLGGIAKGAAYIGTGIDAFQKPEVEDPIQPDFSQGDNFYNDIENTSLEPARQQMDLAANRAIEAAKNAGRGNYGQYVNRVNTILQDTAQNKALNLMQQNQMNNQIAAQKGRREDMKSTQFQREEIRTNIVNAQNRAKQQDLAANFFVQLNNLGTEFQRQQALQDQVRTMGEGQKKQFLLNLALINAKSGNFSTGSLEEIQSALDSGDYNAVIQSLIKYKG